MGLMIVPIVNMTEGAIWFEGSIILFDGSKHFFEISAITQEEMNTLPRVYIHG
jgi:hypothetical protein